MSHHLKLFSGTANQQLASAIAGYLGTQMSVIDISRFRDGKLQIIWKNISYIFPLYL
jgi:phosphoribosylpyrophosphate synthetase